MSKREQSQLVALFEVKTGMTVQATNERGAMVSRPIVGDVRVDRWTWEAIQEAV
jgi:hypothetical protein